MTISTSVWGVQHPNPGGNIHHILYFTNVLRDSSKLYNSCFTILVKKNLQKFREFLFRSFNVMAAQPHGSLAAQQQIQFLSTSIVAAWPRSCKILFSENILNSKKVGQQMCLANNDMSLLIALLPDDWVLVLLCVNRNAPSNIIFFRNLITR